MAAVFAYVEFDENPKRRILGHRSVLMEAQPAQTMSAVQCQGCWKLGGLCMELTGSENVRGSRCNNDSCPGLQPMHWHHGREP